MSPISEREIISQLSGMIESPDVSLNVIKGIGDDCAVLKKNDKDVLLVTCDTLIEGIHFDLRWHPPYQLGRKAAAVNLSDIAAMGGKPTVALLSIGIANPEKQWLEDLFKGFLACLKEHNVLLIGGDTVKNEKACVISVTAIGESKEKEVLYRSGARIGDILWVSGNVGEAAAGLELCRYQAETPIQISDEWQLFIKQHIDPQPQVKLARQLAQSGLVHAMMDISDGLATDVAHMAAASNVGAEINEDLIPAATELKDSATFLGKEVEEFTVRGGEDYQLLFAVPAEQENDLRQIVERQTDQKIYPIGRIVEGEGVCLVDKSGVRKDISYQGFDHFQKK